MRICHEPDKNNHRTSYRWIYRVSGWDKRIVVGEGDTYQEAIDDVTSAIKFHLETFGNSVFQDYDIISADIAEVVI